MEKPTRPGKQAKRNDLNGKDDGLVKLIKEVQLREHVLGDKSLRIIEICYNLMKDRNAVGSGKKR